MDYNEAKQNKEGDKMSEEEFERMGEELDEMNEVVDAEPEDVDTEVEEAPFAKNKLSAVGFASAWLLILCFIFVVGSLTCLVHLSLSALVLPLAVIAALACYGFVLQKEKVPVGGLSLAVVGLAFLVSVVVFGYFTGSIWEQSLWGRGFYAEAVIKMADGWNPIYQGNAGVSEIVYRSSKASWYISASLYAFLGHFEMAKSVTLLFMVPTFVLAYAVFAKILSGKKKLALACALLWVLNPVAIAQVFSFYDDAVLAYAVSAFLFLGYLILDEGYLRGEHLFTMALLWIFILNMQKNGLRAALVLAVAFVFVVVVLFGWRASKWLAPRVAFVAFCGIVIVGFNPFVQNFLDVGAPFASYYGASTLLVNESYVPVVLSNSGWLHAFLYSLFASPDANYSDMNIILQQFTAIVNSAYAQADVRLRGFGFFGGILLLLAMALLLVAFVKPSKKWESQSIYFEEDEENGSCVSMKVVLLWFVLPTLAIGLGHESVWWARCDAVLWLLVPLSILFASKVRGGGRSTVAVFMLTLAFVNCGLTTLSVVPTMSQEGKNIQAFWSRMATGELPTEADAQTFNDYKNNFKAWHTLKTEGEEDIGHSAVWTKVEGILEKENVQ